MEWIKLTVACLFVCVFKCSSKSLNDLEEFSEFLLKTSQLDQILKKGNDPDDDFDEEESASDHAWEDSGKFEGDLILNERQRRVIVQDVTEGLSRNGLRDSTKKWPDNEVVYYIQREHFSGDQVQAIQSGIEDIAGASCLKFRPYKKGDRDAVVIQGSRRGCFSQVGYQSGYQVLNLSGRHPVGRGCFRHGTVVHELLHTLGFYHMQSSPDRDDYINVKWENIIEPARHNFRKYNTFSVSDFGVGYDYDSVLHYSRRAFSSNGQDTLVPKQSGASIGQRVGLSDKDSKKLNKMYCDADSNNYEADEESTHKPANKKKSPKNKPFEGHGIGYHQGKTVVIKLPAAETYKLPDLPTFHVFDYFSKTPQTVSSIIEGFGGGKEIEYSYKPTAAVNIDEHKTLITSHDEINDREIKQDDSYDIHDKAEDPTKTPPDDNAYNEKKKLSENTEVSSPEGNKFSGSSEKVENDLNEAFDRLGNIIKTHVYPSQMPNFSIYKVKDYKEFHKPAQNIETGPEITKVDSSFLPQNQNDDHYDTSDSDWKPPQQYVGNMYSDDDELPSDKQIDEIEVEHHIQEKKYSSERDKSPLHSNRKIDSSYEIPYPLNELRINKKEKGEAPRYAPIKHNQNHTSLHHATTDTNSESPLKGKHTLLGYVLPLKDWYNQVKHKYTRAGGNNANRDYRLYNPPRHRYNAEVENNDESIAPDKQAYSLFGVLVPLTESQKYYKIDFNPHKYSYSIEKAEGH